jgi:hypothetical protein
MTAKKRGSKAGKPNLERTSKAVVALIRALAKQQATIERQELAIKILSDNVTALIRATPSDSLFVDINDDSVIDFNLPVVVGQEICFDVDVVEFRD